MEFIPPIERDRGSIAERGHDRTSTVPVDRLIELSSWMMVLGTIRLTCTFADNVGAFLEAWRTQPITFRMLSWFTHENHLVVALCAAWPLLLGMALRRTRWPELLQAAAATFLILSIGGMMELSAEWSQARGYGVTIGSFHVSRRAFIHTTLSDVCLGLLGTTQLLLELATAVRAVLLVPHFRGAHAAESGRNGGARRARFGRLAVYTSLGYLVLMIRLPVWSTYLEILNNSTIVREFVLRNDIKPIRGPQNFVRNTKEEERLREIRVMLMEAHQAARTDRFLTAKETYIGLISSADSVPQDSWPQGYRSTIAEVLNGLAWLQATCPETVHRDSVEAVRHARRAIEMQPNEGNTWNTLGVAYYRAGEWMEAKDALARSMQLRNEGDSFDWFFLALVQLKLGHRDLALEWYARAVGWFHQSLPNDRELYRFQVEAAQELGLPKPAPPPPSPSINRTVAPPFPVGSPPMQRRLRSRIAGPMPRPASQ
jgi:Tetratricopeptide repeat